MADKEFTANGNGRHGRHGPRGRPFAKGNPGRPTGSKNRVTLITEALLLHEADELLQKAIDLAKSGDKDMLKFLLGRVLPKERAVRIDLPAVDCAEDAVDALAAVAAAASRGEISPAEAAALGSLIGSCARTIDVAEHEAKIDQLEMVLKNGTKARSDE